jgi:hypothetical protein
MPPVVGAPLVAAPVVNAPVVIQHVAVVSQDQVETPMEVEDEDALLQRLFFKRFGRALPDEKEKEKEKDVDINFVIDLTDEDEMEVATSENVPAVAVVKTEPIEIVNVANVTNVNSVYNESGIRVSRRLELIELAKARKAITAFGKSLRKKDFIQEKEAPLAAGTSVIADTDSNMSEDTSVNTESVTTNNTIKMAERAIAETDAAIAANQKEFTAEFGDVPLDEFDN